MKRMLVAVLSVGALAMATLPAGASAGAAKSRANIVQIASSSPQFSTLVKLVKRAGLVAALSGKTQLTVFAPTNAAFAKVPAATLAKLARDKSLLKSVLLYHVVKGRLLAAQLTKRRSLTTLEGGKVKVRVTGGHVHINQAEVTTANVLATNGVIHVINAVLIPPA
jgi:transforming growth factor-beta-induced protein